MDNEILFINMEDLNNNEEINIEVGEPSQDSGISRDDSSSESVFEEPVDLMEVTMEDTVTAELAAAGPVGVAAATAVASVKKRKREFSFETNPTIRKRQYTRLIKKLQSTINEFVTRVGKHAVVLITTPDKINPTFSVFGEKVLVDVIYNLKTPILEQLDNALLEHTPLPALATPGLFELPALVFDGIPTAVEEMTQGQLRSFIPIMLKYSTGRDKPRWGRESFKPAWWPSDIPWANIRFDMRSDEDKRNQMWTNVLQQIVISCYKYHGREDLLSVFSEQREEMMQETQVIQIDSYPDSDIDSSSIINIIHTNPNNIIFTQDPLSTENVQNNESAQIVQLIDECNLIKKKINFNSLKGAVFTKNGQILLINENGQTFPVTVSRVTEVPLSNITIQPTTVYTLPIIPTVNNSKKKKNKPNILK